MRQILFRLVPHDTTLCVLVHFCVWQVQVFQDWAWYTGTTPLLALCWLVLQLTGSTPPCSHAQVVFHGQRTCVLCCPDSKATFEAGLDSCLVSQEVQQAYAGFWT